MIVVRKKQKENDDKEKHVMEMKLQQISEKTRDIENRVVKNIRKRQVQLRTATDMYSHKVEKKMMVNQSVDMVKTYNIVRHQLDKNKYLSEHQKSMELYREYRAKSHQRTADEQALVDDPHRSYLNTVKPRVRTVKQMEAKKKRVEQNIERHQGKVEERNEIKRQLEG
jgi:hypothetical protein